MASPKKERLLPRVLFCCLLASIFSASQAQADAIVLIGNKNITIDSISAKQAKKIWLGKLKKLPDQGKIRIVDQATNTPAYHHFYQRIIKKNPAQIKAYWAKLSFMGKAFPPQKLDSDTSVLEWVANTPNALGYVNDSAVNPSVKRLLSVK
jgi:ABC-type phosphate transport system substrate-binding protein